MRRRAGRSARRAYRQQCKTLLFLSLAATGKLAAADASGLELGWSAPPDCPAKESVRQEIERILHGPVRLPEGERLSVRAEITSPREGGFWRVDVDTDNGRRSARRRIEAASCEELANATALVVAILINPRAVLEQDAEGAIEKKSSAAVAPHDDGPSISAARDEHDRGSLEGWVGIGVGAGEGYLPKWSAGLGLQGGVGWSVIRAQVGGLAWLPSRETLDANGTQGANFRLLSAYSELCLQPTWNRWALGPCAGVEIARLEGTGFGPAVRPDPHGAISFAASAGALLRWIGPGRLSVPLDLELVIPFAKRRFVFTGSDPAVVHVPATLGARVILAAEFRL